MLGCLRLFLARIVPMIDSGSNDAYTFGNSCYVHSFAVHSNLRMHVDRSSTVHIWTVKSGHGQIVSAHFCEQEQALLISGKWKMLESGRTGKAGGIFCCDRGRL